MRTLDDLRASFRDWLNKPSRRELAAKAAENARLDEIGSEYARLNDARADPHSTDPYRLLSGAELDDRLVARGVMLRREAERNRSLRKTLLLRVRDFAGPSAPPNAPTEPDTPPSRTRSVPEEPTAAPSRLAPGRREVRR